MLSVLAGCIDDHIGLARSSNVDKLVPESAIPVHLV
jgi:hypothetical protein